MVYTSSQGFYQGSIHKILTIVRRKLLNFAKVLLRMRIADTKLSLQKRPSHATFLTLARHFTTKTTPFQRPENSNLQNVYNNSVRFFIDLLDSSIHIRY